MGRWVAVAIGVLMFVVGLIWTLQASATSAAAR